MCKNRIKPILLRDIKTEALLVFIRTTLEDYFSQIENDGYYFRLESKEDHEFVVSTLRNLLNNLKDTVINSSYLRSLIKNALKNPSLKFIVKKEEPLMVYYDSIVKEIDVQLKDGSSWMPELIVISLLSEWIIEKEKSMVFYPYLKDINYLNLLNCYDISKVNLDLEKRKTLMNMYKISSKLIIRLEKTKYNMNTRIRKNRK